MVGVMENLEVFERMWKLLMSGDRMFSGENRAILIDLCYGGETALNPDCRRRAQC